jgi:3'(2'), 5'-bisphosphate nucleotidase
VNDRDCDDVAQRLAAIAIEAGRILRRYQAAPPGRRLKDDGSPSTAADTEAEVLILARLESAFPGIPAIAEETANAEKPARRFFLVDPLDGTRDYLNGSDEYTVNVALIEGDRPIAAAVAAPGTARVWSAGASVHEGAIPEHGTTVTWRPVAVRRATDDGLVALVSRLHGDPATEACLASLSIGTRRSASSALKFCLIASGEADVYVRCGRTMEWDTAAGDHVLTRAGGGVIGPGGAPLTYGHEDRGYGNPPFAALGDLALAKRLSLPAAAARG